MAKREPVFRVYLRTLAQLLAASQSPLKLPGVGKDRVGVMISFANLAQHRTTWEKSPKEGLFTSDWSMDMFEWGDCHNSVNRYRKT